METGKRSCFKVTPLHIAAFNGNIRLIRLLIENGADVNAVDEMGRTPLKMARSRFNKEAEKILLEHGAKEEVEG